MNRWIKRRIIFGLAAGFSVLVCQAIVPETVIGRNQGGKLSVQVRDLENGASYNVGAFEIGSDKPTQTIAVPLSNGQSVVNLPDLPLAPGVYQLRVEKNGEWLPLAQLPPVILPKEGFQLVEGAIERRTGEIKFTLPANGLYRITAINEASMHIKHIQGWRFGGAAEKITAKWDFRDDGGVRNYFTSVGLFVVMDFVPLPEGYVVVGAPELFRYEESPLFAQLKLPTEIYEAKLSLPGAKTHSESDGKSKTEIPLISPQSQLRVEVAPESLSLLKTKRFEILYFIDGEFVHEETDGVSPATLIIPSLKRPPGLAYLTVNVKDFFGNVGSRTIKVWWDESGNQP